MRISAVVITLNEEINIARCIESLIPVADEIVIVDALSSDATQNICSNYNVRFVSHKWEGYAKQKNFANSLATNDLILSIDADEALSAQLQQSILKIKKQDKYEHGFVFTMAMLPFYNGKWIRHSGLHPDRKKRLWNRNDGQWQGLVHETLHFSSDVKVVRLKGDLLHYISDSELFNQEKSDKYAELKARQMYSQGKKSNVLKIACKTAWAFFNTFFIRLGFLDGSTGFRIAVNKAQYTKRKYRLLMDFMRQPSD